MQPDVLEALFLFYKKTIFCSTFNFTAKSNGRYRESPRIPASTEEPQRVHLLQSMNPHGRIMITLHL